MNSLGGWHLQDRIGPGRRQLGQVGSDLLQELGFAPRSGDPHLRLSVLEQDQRRDAHYLEAPRYVEVLVDVELGYLNLARVLAGDLLEHRGDHLARAAPLSPEIHQYRGVSHLDMLVKASVAQGSDLVAHAHSSVGPPTPSSSLLTGRVFQVKQPGIATHSTGALAGADRAASVASSHRSASIAAMQPEPEAVTA